MKINNYFILAIVSACFAFSCEQSHPLDIECQGDEQYCYNSQVYSCVEQIFVKNENIQCMNGCDISSRACKCADGCVNGCDETGVCKCKDDCVNGCDETGACKCADDCVNGCDKTGVCKCADDCPNVCRTTGECICQKGDAVCTGTQDVKECFDNVWVSRTCSAGCKKGSEENRDVCISFVCHEGDVQCKPENNKMVQNCENNAWQDEQTECEIGCYNGKCMSSEFIQLEPDTTSIRLLASSLTTENTKSVVARYLVNGELTPGELSVTASDENCVVIDKETLGDGKFKLTMTAGANAQKCTIDVTLKAGNVEKTMDVRVYDSNEDANGNHLLDYYETASKQGEDCTKYHDCDSNDGKEMGFCDSFIGYHCSTKCTDDVQCVPDETIDGNIFHYICRNDGRCAPDTFETVWKTVNAGESIKILLKNAQKCEFNIDWGDNTKEEINNCNEDLVHSYPTIGKHHVKIKGTLLGWHTVSGIKYLSDSDDKIGVDEDDNDNAPKLLEVVSFGTVGFDGSINHGFANATNLAKLSAVDIPDASELKSMKEMFTNARKMNYPIGNWDTSNVIDMVNAFSFAASFNQDIGHWDTSKVTNMSGMFYNAVAFNQNIGDWDISNVFSISDMFHSASAFNSNISKWNTSNVARMIYVFYKASTFNQDIGKYVSSRGYGGNVL